MENIILNLLRKVTKSLLFIFDKKLFSRKNFYVIILSRIEGACMLGKIISIVDNIAKVKLSIDIDNQANLVNIHTIFEDGNKRIVGEIVNIDKEFAYIKIVGMIENNSFIPGFSKKPAFRSTVRIVTMDELALILGPQQIEGTDRVYLGKSSIYSNYRINVSLNDFFSSHFAVLGNSGAGKSCTVARLIQNLFTSSTKVPVGAHIFLFDAYGEYTNAFKNIHQISPQLNYKYYTTNTHFPEGEVLKIPLWLLGTDDICLLLNVDNPAQIPIVEKALKYVTVLKDDNPDVINHKNDIIARALLDILMSSNDASKIRDQIIAVLTKFNTPTLNLESIISQPGYNRTLKQCIYVDNSGKIQDIDVVVDFVRGFVVDGLELKEPDGSIMYTLNDLENAFDFALISEGILKSDKVFDYANVLTVRLHSIVNSSAKEYFDYGYMTSKEDFIRRLTTTPEGKPCQIVNFNINYVDDRMAKTLTKIISKMLFDYSVAKKNRGSEPYHIIIEEAHRYVQKDRDLELLGYNIFDRITKEGRKYGVILGLITQRPSELSDTSISQCSNFIVLRTLHPLDIDYIRNMVPYITTEVVEQLKSLQPGHCIAFGAAFKVATNIIVDLPNPRPLSNNSDVNKSWYGQNSN